MDNDAPTVLKSSFSDINTEDYLKLLENLRESIREQGINPADPVQLKPLISAAISDYEQMRLLTGAPELADSALVHTRLLNELSGYGDIQMYLDDPEVEEIWINSPSEVYISRRGVSELTPLRYSREGVETLLEKMLKPSGRRIDISSPFVDASLPDGSRLHAVIPDITRKNISINIRKFIVRARALNDLVAMGSLSRAAAQILQAAVASGMNILVSGATQAGKTTMLNCLAAAIPPRERVITCEEIFELSVPLRDVVGMQCRQQNLEGTGEISLRRLVKESLRMRPDRILIGEVREAESLDMLIALNAGLPGMCTIHANSARDAITKLCTLPLLAGENITSQFVVPAVAHCIDLVVHCERAADGTRRVAEIYALGGRVEEGTIEMAPLFTRQNGHLVCTGMELPRPAAWERAGYSVEHLIQSARTEQSNRNGYSADYGIYASHTGSSSLAGVGAA